MTGANQDGPTLFIPGADCYILGPRLSCPQGNLRGL